MSFLDCNGALVPYSYEPWKDEGKRDSKKIVLQPLTGVIIDLLSPPSTETPTKGTNRMSPTLNQDSSFGDRQFMVITSEKQCRIVALPSQNCVYRLQITETDFVVRAEIVSMKGNERNGGEDFVVVAIVASSTHPEKNQIKTKSLQLQIACVSCAMFPTVT